MRPYRVNIPMYEDELQALSKMAEAEFRQPQEQVRFLLVEELRRRGLLPTESQETSLKGVERHASAAR